MTIQAEVRLYGENNIPTMEKKILNQKFIFYKLVYREILQPPYRKINLVIYFKNLTVGLHVIYVLNMHVKFRRKT